MKQSREEKNMECKCNRCTYNEKIKMRLDDLGFWKANCPRCGSEYLKAETKNR